MVLNIILQKHMKPKYSQIFSITDKWTDQERLEFLNLMNIRYCGFCGRREQGEPCKCSQQNPDGNPE